MSFIFIPFTNIIYTNLYTTEIEMPDNTQIITIICMLIPLIFAVTVHEAAHAYVAKWRGDNTASMLGRLTLNPVSHIDPIGTIVLPILMLILGTSFIFGWAKPVPVNYNKLKSPKKRYGSSCYCRTFS